MKLTTRQGICDGIGVSRDMDNSELNGVVDITQEMVDRSFKYFVVGGKR